MCQSLQIIVHNGLGSCFGTWAKLITHHSLCIGLFYLLLYIGISVNVVSWTEYYDGKTIWSPEGNPSIMNEIKMKELYPDEMKVMTTAEDTIANGFLYASEVYVMIEAKEQLDGSSHTLFTPDMFKEMIALEEFILQLTSPEINANLVEPVNFYDLCRKVNITDTYIVQQAAIRCESDPNACLEPIEEKCKTTGRPLDFIYDRKTDSYDIESFPTEMDLIRRVQSGKGDQNYMYYGDKILFTEIIFAGTVPEEPVQDYVTGKNDLYRAKSARWVYQFDNKKLADGWTRELAQAYELFIQEEISLWGDNSQYLQVAVFTRDAWEHSFIANVFEDLKLIAISMTMVITYSLLVLGGFNPVHFRCCTALIGMFVVFLSLACGYGIAFAAGLKVSRFHDILPFMIMGIGVDDMFVIVNTIDQQPTHLKAKERFKQGFKHAGPSITITSVTNALAFFVGSLSTLPAIRSLCLFAGIIICTLYFGFLTIFSPWFFSDLKRQHAKKGDCCGLCCCRQDTIFCCKGYFLTEKQKEFVGLPADTNIDPDKEYASGVEKFLNEHFAPKVLSFPGRMTVLFCWSIFLIVAAFGVSEVRTGFSMELFIPVDSYTDKFYQMDMKYFQTGFDMETIVENPDIDFSSEQAQLDLTEFYDRLERCYLCEKPWFYKYSLNAWYPQFKAFVDSGLCSHMPEGLGSFQKVVPQEHFYPCLNEALELVDKEKAKQLRWSDESKDRKIIGFKTKIHAHRVPDASQDGIAYLTDIRDLENQYAPEGTFSYAIIFLDFEMWYTFTSELTLCLSLSIAVILLIILVVTANFYITVLVALCVGITDMFLFALIYYWGLALNPIVLMHVIVSIGISVDYSAHIAYAYLVEPVPDSVGADTPTKIRVHKAKMALRRMGSSVFHGGFSTFIAIFVLAPGTTYIFLAFFRLWFGIILFGMMNGFLFLPVVLSFIGPTKSVVDPAHMNNRRDKEVPDFDTRSVSSVKTATTVGTNRGSDEGLFSMKERKRMNKLKSADSDRKQIVDADAPTPSSLGGLTSKQSVELADVKTEWLKDNNTINEED